MSCEQWMNEPAADPSVVAVRGTVTPQTEHGGPLTSVAITCPPDGIVVARQGQSLAQATKKPGA
jgi:hypothetical protein